jgi:Tol biopolymer transport system component
MLFNKNRFILKLFLLLFILSFNSAFAQFTDFHPELNWYTIKGKHVVVHFHDGAERTARVVAKIADEVWGPLTSLYHYEPETVHFVIKDIDDYSNGATYFFDNKIEIWTSALDFDLRGTHNWLRNVISHELTHMVQIQASMKMSRTIPAFYIQALNYEDERRPDILYGFPNFILSYPIATVNVPAWFAEGTAQYMRKDFHYDTWDTHRDMILRSYALDGDMLTWNQMGVFEKTSLGNESVYNAGFALTRYISQKYGEDKLRKISEALSKLSNVTIDQAFEDVLHKDGLEVYDEWRDFVTTSYKERSEDVLSNLVEGKKIDSVGFGNFYPKFSEDGTKFIYISNKGSDYLSIAGIYLHNLKTNTDKLLVNNVRSTVSWIKGTNKIVYSKLGDDNPNFYNVHDLYVYDIDKDSETRLTHDLRANQPDVSHDGSKIVFLFEKDGTTNLGSIDIEGKKIKQLTFFQNGEQVYDPKFSDDDSYIIFGYSDKDGRDIMKVDVDGSHLAKVLATKDDERNPVLDKNGNLIYSSDKSGIFNIYSLNLKTNEKKQLTNVIGGAFMPSVSSNGDILYAGYTSTGYKIFNITPEEQAKVNPEKKYVWKKDPPLGEDKPNGDIANFNLKHLQNYDDSKTPDYKKEKYSGSFSKLSFYPILRLDNYNTTNSFIEKLKPGLIVSSMDMLNRYSLFAGGTINTRGERDLFLTLEYRNKIPGLFDLGLKPAMTLELYNITRKSNVNVYFGADTVGNTVNYDFIIPTVVTYNLFEVDLAAKYKIFTRNQGLEFRFIFSRYTANLSSFLLPDKKTLYPSSNDTYLIGRNFQIKYTLDAEAPYIDSDINPVGTHLELQYNYEFNKFNPDGKYTVVDGILQPDYTNFNFHRVELNLQSHYPITHTQTISARVRAGAILGPSQPDFFDYFLGGLIGMREYPFYSISGNKVAWLNLTYRFPLAKNIDTRIGQLYVDKVFLSFFGDIGDAWTGNAPSLNQFKKGVGSEVRVMMNSFYIFPTAVFFSAAYGFDRFTRTINDLNITYGKEWRFYGGIAFGFDF